MNTDKTDKKEKQSRKGERHRAIKLDRDKVQELNAQGLTATDIAKHQGVAISTITRYLDSIKPLKDTINRYARDHADILTLSQLKKQAIEDIIVDNILSNPSNLKSQDLRLQKEILHTMQGGKYYDHQAERLEKGESTDNSMVLVTRIKEVQEFQRGLDINDD